MSHHSWKREIRWIQAAGLSLAPGLSEAQLLAAEQWHGFAFPPDLRSLLSTAMPTGKGFPDWREPGSKDILAQLNWPAESIAFDVRYNHIWFNEWGAKPSDLQAAVAHVRQIIKNAPVLIPIYGHRYMPSEPHEPANPVLSVYQTDIIYYGMNLRAYLAKEFQNRPPRQPRRIHPNKFPFGAT